MDSGHEIVLIITSKASPEYLIDENDYKLFAQKHNIPFRCTSRISETVDIIKECKGEIGVSMNWPGIIKEDVIGLFSKGILNSHPGDLPRYRGNACPNWAIINHEKRVALTIHFMESGVLDSGDILVKKYYDLGRETTIGDVYSWLEQVIPTAFKQAVEGIETCSISPKSQNDLGLKPLRAFPRIPQDSFIDWNQDAATVDMIIRSSSCPFIGAYTYWKRKKLYILESGYREYPFDVLSCPGQVTSIDRENGTVGVATTKGELIIKKVRYDDATICPTEIITSMRSRLGMNVEEEIENIWQELQMLRSSKCENQ